MTVNGLYILAEAQPVDVTGMTFGLTAMVITTVVFLFVVWLVADYRKSRIRADQQEQVRQLVNRYEQLSASSLDAQQRTATDLAELRARLQSVEQLLRTVDGG